MIAGTDASSSLERLLTILELHNPCFKALIAADSEEDFVAATEGGLERAMQKIEGGSKEYSKLDEPGLSHIVVDLLSAMGWRATAETNSNGHVDVVVESAFGGGWKYLGECKIYKGYQYHIDGCEQLLGYCTGREKRGFCMDFIKSKGAFSKMSAIRDRMNEERPLNQQSFGVDHDILGAFLTNHAHASGSVVEILHLGCSVMP